MGIDAVIALKTRSRALLDPLARRGHLIIRLRDGALVHTFGRFDGFRRERLVAELWLQEALPGLRHPDPRGVLFFPDVCEPRARAYAGVVAQVSEAGFWVKPRAVSPEERQARLQQTLAEVDAWTALMQRSQGDLDAMLATPDLPPQMREALEHMRRIQQASKR